MAKNLNLVWELTPDDLAIANHKLSTVSPDDGKYSQDSLEPYLSAKSEWQACAFVQKMLLETRVEMWLAPQSSLNELNDVFWDFDPLNASLLEGEIKHDQLAVIEELWRHVSEDTKALLHPGTTSYDILDTARSHLLKRWYEEQFRPMVAVTIKKLIELAEDLNKPAENGNTKFLQTGRTHLQDTSPVPFWVTIAWYAARLSDRLEKCDTSFAGLKWKVSGIVGTWASVDMVIWPDKSLEFEKQVLAKLWLQPDYTATQVVQKESLADVWNSIVTLMTVLWDFANDMRLLYMTAIWEVTSRTWAARLGWSSADASKNNPINWENIKWKVAVVESGMRVLYELIQTDLQRDLTGSVQARYQPQLMITETFESFARASRALDSLSVNEDKMSENLQKIRENPSEALVAILRWEWWVHSKIWVWHDFVKAMAKKSKAEWRNLMEVCHEDLEFAELFLKLSEDKQAILNGELELYIGNSLSRAWSNLAYAKWVVSKDVSNLLKWKSIS